MGLSFNECRLRFLEYEKQFIYWNHRLRFYGVTSAEEFSSITLIPIGKVLNCRYDWQDLLMIYYGNSIDDESMYRYWDEDIQLHVSETEEELMEYWNEGYFVYPMKQYEIQTLVGRSIVGDFSRSELRNIWDYND